jgi:hypothetical protein
VRARTVASALLAGAATAVLAGCGLVTPQATTFQYDPSDGVSATVGDVEVEGLLVITDDGELGNLLFTAVNGSDAGVNLNVQYDSSAGRQTHTIALAASSTYDVGYGPLGQFAVEDIDSPAGSLLPVYLQYGDAAGAQVLVPVLDGSLPQYTDLVPTPMPTPTPTPTSTADPDAEPTDDDAESGAPDSE